MLDFLQHFGLSAAKEVFDERNRDGKDANTHNI